MLLKKNGQIIIGIHFILRKFKKINIFSKCNKIIIILNIRVVTMSTIGYGDITPETIVEK